MLSIKTWTNGMIGGAAYCLAVLVLNVLRKQMTSVFEYKIESWYFMMSVLPGCMIAVADIMNFGTSNGIMVVLNVDGMAYRNVYYN